MATKVKFPVNVAVLLILPFYTMYEGGSKYEVLSSLMFSLLVGVPLLLLYVIVIKKIDIFHIFFNAKRRTEKANQSSKSGFNQYSYDSTGSRSKEDSSKGSSSRQYSYESAGSDSKSG